MIPARALEPCDRCGYLPCAEDAITPPCTEENYIGLKEGDN